ncbi:hypothetical protein [Halovenus salina]|uniref:Uncharacterized protein n=1 Tax=Halovenus salina TaxID=1510225 RepID=A0ABD5VXY5_9EURY
MVGYTVFSQAVLLAAGIGLSGLAVRTYRSEKKPVGRAFSALLVLLGATAFCLGITGGTGVPNKLIWLFTNLSIPVALLAFSFNYYGITLLGSRVRAAAALTPAVLGFAGGTLLILGTPSKSPGPEAPLDAVAALPAGVFDAATVFDRIGLYYTAGVVVFAVGLVAVNVLRYEHLTRGSPRSSLSSARGPGSATSCFPKSRRSTGISLASPSCRLAMRAAHSCPGLWLARLACSPLRRLPATSAQSTPSIRWPTA